MAEVQGTHRGEGHAERSADKGMRCVVVTPEATVLDDFADFVAVPLYDGELGIAPLHCPMIGRLGYGELRIRQGEQTLRYYVDSGFVEVADNLVSVLTNRAVPSQQIDPQVAGEHLAEALRRAAHTPELMAIRDRVEGQSRAQIRVASRQAG